MSKSQDMNQICELLTRLSGEELGEVRRRASFLGGGDPVPGTPGVGGDWLLSGIEVELRRRGLIGRGRLPADQIRRGWEGISAALREELSSKVQTSKRGRAVDEALGRMVARALADWLVLCRVPVGPKTMLRSAERIWDALDSQFPGYLEAGLLHCCLEPERLSA